MSCLQPVTGFTSKHRWAPSRRHCVSTSLRTKPALLAELVPRRGSVVGELRAALLALAECHGFDLAYIHRLHDLDVSVCAGLDNAQLVTYLEPPRPAGRARCREAIQWPSAACTVGRCGCIRVWPPACRWSMAGRMHWAALGAPSARWARTSRARRLNACREVIEDGGEQYAAALLVTACNKLHNVRSIVADLEAIDPAVFERFTVGREDTHWYYREVQAVLCQ